MAHSDELARLQVAVDELSILNDLAIAASTSLEVEKMLEIIVHKSVKALHAEQGALQLVTEHSDAPLRTFVRRMDSESRIMPYSVGINITGWVLKYQKTLVIEDLASDPRFHSTPEECTEIHSVLCVPVQFRARLLGVLMVINHKSGTVFSPEDQRLLSIIAAQSGQLIHNIYMQQAELEKIRLKHELEMAHKVQYGLLPKGRPPAEAFEMAICYEPAEVVAGDYYDYFQLDDNGIGIVIADVSGHGVPAALVMTLVKGVLHSVVHKSNSPGAILTDVNAVLGPILPPQIFVSMVFMLLDVKNMCLRIASAGHPPVLVARAADGTCAFVECRGLALGLKSDSRYEEKEQSLAPGDFILAYTDGVTEAADAGHEMFGDQRLLEAAASAVNETAAGLVERIRQSVREFSGHADHNDDIAMIGIKMSSPH